MPVTPREREVLSRVCDGQQTKQIAFALGVSEQAVKAHITHLFKKFGVRNRAGLVATALRTGVAEPRDGAARTRVALARAQHLQDEQRALVARAGATLRRRSR